MLSHGWHPASRPLCTPRTLSSHAGRKPRGNHNAPAGGAWTSDRAGVWSVSGQLADVPTAPLAWTRGEAVLAEHSISYTQHTFGAMLRLTRGEIRCYSD